MRRLLGLSFVLFVLLLTGVSADAAAMERTVIVTSDALREPFEDYSEWKNSVGWPTFVETISNIESSYDGNDVPDKIRNYLIDMFEAGEIDGVVLGGNIDHVPVRYLRDYSWNYPIGVDIASDAYYSGLDGDWDANGNGIYGEPPVSRLNIETDLADLVPELRVGRIPAGTAQDVLNYRNKQHQYMTTVSAEGRPSRLLGLAEVLFDGDWQIGDCDVCSPDCEPGVPCVSSDGATELIHWITDYEEEVPQAEVVELYERDYWWVDRGRSGAQPLRLGAFLQPAARGSDIVVHVGRGDSSAPLEWSLGPDRATIEDVRYPSSSGILGVSGLVVSSQSFSNKFGESNMGEAWILANNAGSLLSLAPSNLSFPASDRRIHERLRELWIPAASESSIGKVVREVRREVGEALLDWESPTRFHLYSLNLLGDPDTRIPLKRKTGLGPVVADVPPSDLSSAFLSIHPNPGTSEARLQLRLGTSDDVAVSVTDVTGREIVHLHAGPLAAGSHQWKLDEETLTVVPAGIYYVRVESGSRLLARKKWVRLR